MEKSVSFCGLTFNSLGLIAWKYEIAIYHFDLSDKNIFPLKSFDYSGFISSPSI